MKKLAAGFAAVLVLVALVYVAWMIFGSESDGRRYVVYFERPVEALDEGAAVRRNGVRVGEVVGVDLDPDRPDAAKATLSIRPEIRLKEDASATLRRSGLAGEAYVSVVGGSPDAPDLAPGKDGGHPEIRAKSGGGDGLMGGLLGGFGGLSEAIENVRQVSETVAENRDAIDAIIANLQEASAEAVKAAARIRAAAANADEAIASARQTFEKTQNLMADEIERAAGEVGEAAATVNEGAEGVRRSAEQIARLVAENRRPIRSFTTNGLDRFIFLMNETRDMVDELDQLARQLQRQPSEVIFGNEDAGFRPDQR